MFRYLISSLFLIIVVMSCGQTPDRTPAAVTKPEPPPGPDPRPVILAFGDSLTAGHGVGQAESYPSKLQKELDLRGFKYRVINSGVSGDTTSGGLSRIDAALNFQPKVVILELGGNDGLRGTPLREVRQNLAAMIEKCQSAGATVLLAGMTLPLNLGPDYIRDFESLFTGLAKEYKTQLIPFFLEGVAAQADLNLDDGIHPTGGGYAIIARTVMRHLEPLLTR